MSHAEEHTLPTPAAFSFRARRIPRRELSVALERMPEFLREFEALMKRPFVRDEARISVRQWKDDVELEVVGDTYAERTSDEQHEAVRAWLFGT